MATYDLRLTEPVFLGLTPRLIEALLRRRDLELQLADQRAGVVAAVLANIHATKGRSFEPADFFPSLGEVDGGYMSPEESVMAMKAWATGHNARLEGAEAVDAG